MAKRAPCAVVGRTRLNIVKEQVVGVGGKRTKMKRLPVFIIVMIVIIMVIVVVVPGTRPVRKLNPTATENLSRLFALSLCAIVIKRHKLSRRVNSEGSVGRPRVRNIGEGRQLHSGGAADCRLLDAGPGGGP